ncbi:MAG: acetate kinase, partial [Paracoccaceae bacterium]|nr:acetate kinase [Paracoccaceae bacterium]
QVHGIDGAARILNRESGLLGLGGASDMRALLAADTDAARFAVAHFCASVVRHAGAMIAAMGGLDAVVFTAGIGEKAAAVRTEILTSLAWAGVEFCSIANEQNDFLLNSGKSKIAVWIVRAQEEVQIAAEALEVRGREA